jgi:hypothetical protein
MNMRVSLAPKQRGPMAPAGSAPARALLNPDGARVILGAGPTRDGLAAPIVPAADALFGPRGACLANSTGPLFVCDTGHHRLLVWRRPPVTDGEAADFLIGQADFDREGRNGKGEVGAATLNVPTGLSAADGILAVADAWNHRVLIWHGYPDRNNRGADVVLGQSDFTQSLANASRNRPAADTLNWCYSVTIADGKLFVADTGNRRVLVWNEIPTRNGQPADLVLGQTDFSSRDENAGGAPDAHSMRWPHAISFNGAALLVADAGNNRVMVWRDLPDRNGAPCDAALGQEGFAQTDNNQSQYYPSARSFNMPYGLVASGETIVVADTANSRLLGFDARHLGQNVAAVSIAGQGRFNDKGDNRWGFATRDSFCWPYGVSACGDCVVIADSGNNRVLLWERAA